MCEHGTVVGKDSYRGTSLLVARGSVWRKRWHRGERAGRPVPAHWRVWRPPEETDISGEQFALLISVTFGMPLEHSRGGTEQAVGDLVLELNKEVLAGDRSIPL